MEKSKRQIVIIESTPTDMMGKMAQALRKKGYETVLITLTGDLETNFLKDSYDKRIAFDSKYFKANLKNLPKIGLYSLKYFPKLTNAYGQIKKLTPYVVIARTNPNWLCFLTKKYFRKSPVIYFPYDLRSFCYEDLNDALKHRIPKFEINAERWCFENCDGIMHKGEEKELTYLNKKVLGDLNITCPTLHFLPYCLSNLIIPIKRRTPKKEINIVFVGHIGVEDAWKKSIEFVLKNKIHLHLYGKSGNVGKKESEKKGVYDYFADTGYFHLHSQIDQENLSKEISKYDYGIWMGYYDVLAKNITTCTGNKLASYLEAGLPIIYFKNHEYIGEILEKYHAGVKITINSPLRKILENQNYKELLKGVENARTELTMENNISKLEDFFKKVREHRSKNKK